MRMKNRSLRKMGNSVSRKPRNILICGIFSLIFLMSLFSNGVIPISTVESQNSSSNNLKTSAWQLPFLSDYGRFYMIWNDLYTEQAEVEQFADLLEAVYYQLTTRWSLPDPMEGGYEPPVEVWIPDTTGYNGMAVCWGDENFTLQFLPQYLAHTDPDYFNYAEPKKVAGHEMFHLTQFRHPGDPPKDWVIEGQARMLQDKLSDWLDHADGTELGTSYLRELNGYLESSTDIDLTQLSYAACLFWNYYLEQFGADKTDADYGIDALTTFWDTAVNPVGQDGITMLNKALNSLSPGTTFDDVFENFCVANYAKDLADSTVPSEWKYVDDNAGDGSAAYSSLIDPTILNLSSGGSWQSSFELMNYACKYKEIGLDPDVNAVTIQINETIGNTLFYALLAIRGNDLVYSYTVESNNNFRRAIVNDNYDKIALIVVTLDNEFFNTAVGDYRVWDSDPEVTIETPNLQYKARAGPHNASEKFVAVVDVSDMTIPIHGFSTENFRATVGLEPATVVSAVDVYGKYFLEIQAPNQTADGLYALRVDLVDNDGTSIGTSLRLSSVEYGEIYIDNAVVIDHSASMSTNNKLLAAQNAAILYVNSYLSGDQMAVVKYNNSATVLHQLTKLDSTNRSNAITAIEGITAIGQTSIGDGLWKGQDELTLRGIANYSKEIILLSDGLENRMPSIADVKPMLQGNATKVHAITIGSDADHAKMQDLAADTGGSYHFCFDPSSGDIPNDLAEIYRSIVGTVRNLQRFYQARGNVTGNSSFLIPVGNEADMIEIVVNYNSSATPTITLESPNGTTISQTREYDAAGMGHKLYRISNPDFGPWRVNISPVASLNYFIEGAEHGMITMRVMAPPIGSVSSEWGKAHHIGDRIPIMVSLSDTQPIRNADVWMETTPPGYKSNLTKFLMPLLDDGGHGDGAPNDGIYGNYFTQTSENGTYSFLINATGVSGPYGPFTRLKTGAFHVFKDTEPLNYDTDLDGLPNKWEKFHGLNASSAVGEDGALGDPDRDELMNEDEFFYGTHPLKGDTDEGGQGDGSEISKGQQPLHPRDDTIDKFPNIRTYPGNWTVSFLISANPSDYDNLTVFRSSTPVFNYGAPIFNGPFTINFTDPAVINYNTYYYRFAAQSLANGKTGLSRAYEIMPKDNVLAPEGCLIINNGTKLTKMTNVSLTIYQVENDGTLSNAFNATEMRLTNNLSALENTTWVTYQQDVAWNLSSDGTWPKFMFAQLRDNQTIPEVSPIFSAGMGYGTPGGNGGGEPPIGPESTLTVVIILADLLVVIVIYYKKRKPKSRDMFNYVIN